jgi:hypothetical protein
MAFNPKNLQYEKQEPAFLRRLKGEYGGLDGRHNVQIARPKKDRLKTGDEDEDDPVIVDEQGERIEKDEFERRMRGEHGAELENPESSKSNEKADELALTGKTKEAEAERQKVTEIGGSSSLAKKRKAAKVVGGDVDDGNDNARRISKQEESRQAKIDEEPSKKDPTAPKKKSKKIKLSFDEPDS